MPTFALQKHVLDNSKSEDTQGSVETSFYVDNCLQSFTSSETAKDFVDRLSSILSSGGFDWRQWASNDPSVISHFQLMLDRKAICSGLSEGHQDAQESNSWATLALLIRTLSPYKQRRTDHPLPNYAEHIQNPS